MQSSRTRAFRMAYSLTPETLRRMVDFIYSVEPNLLFNVSCSDGSTLTVNTVQQLLELSNPAHREITRIAIRSEWASKSPTHVELTLNTDDNIWAVSYLISGDDKDVVYVSAEIEKWLSGVRTYNLSSVPRTARFISSMLATSVGSSLFLLGIMDATGHSNRRMPWWFIWLGLVLTLSAVVVSRIRRWLYPVGDFAIGDGAGRSARRQQLRSNLFWVVLVGIILGVLIDVITKHLH